MTGPGPSSSPAAHRSGAGSCTPGSTTIPPTRATPARRSSGRGWASPGRSIRKTVVRGGYGLFWAPHQYPGIGSTALGTRGFTGFTDYVASTDGGLTPCAGCSIVNPFPSGIYQPTGSVDGILTGAGGTVDFIDQFRQSAYVHQYSFDIQRELPGRIVAGIAYIGATSKRLGVGGNDDGVVNINQLDPRHLSLGSALLESVPNPFFGDSRIRSPRRPGDRPPQPAPAALPAVRRHPGPPGQRGPRPVPLGGPEAGAAHHERLGRPHQLHLEQQQEQRLRRAQPVQQRQQQRGPAAQQLRPGRRVRPLDHRAAASA